MSIGLNPVSNKRGWKAMSYFAFPMTAQIIVMNINMREPIIQTNANWYINMLRRKFGIGLRNSYLCRRYGGCTKAKLFKMQN